MFSSVKNATISTEEQQSDIVVPVVAAVVGCFIGAAIVAGVLFFIRKRKGVFFVCYFVGLNFYVFKDIVRSYLM